MASFFPFTYPKSVFGQLFSDLASKNTELLASLKFACIVKEACLYTMSAINAISHGVRLYAVSGIYKACACLHR
jgi:hypothetical protein